GQDRRHPQRGSGAARGVQVVLDRAELLDQRPLGARLKVRQRGLESEAGARHSGSLQRSESNPPPRASRGSSESPPSSRIARASISCRHSRRSTSHSAKLLRLSASGPSILISVL